MKKRLFSMIIEFALSISYKLLQKVIEEKIKGDRNDRKTRKKT